MISGYLPKDQWINDHAKVMQDVVPNPIVNTPQASGQPLQVTLQAHFFAANGPTFIWNVTRNSANCLYF